MRIYLAKRISGYYMGQFRSIDWMDRPPTIQPTVCVDVMGIERDTLVAYWKYLWRLGEYTWGRLWVAPEEPGKVGIPLEEFATYFVYQLWPAYGRLWSAVGAYAGRFDTQTVVRRVERFEPPETSRVLQPYNIILRYREMLWWGRSVFKYDKMEWLYEMGPVIGEVLMFERRGYGVAKKYEDEWNFGMLWWEIFGVPGRFELYLWAAAEVRYLGMGIRKSAKMLSLQVK